MWTNVCNHTIDKQEEEIVHASECVQRWKWPLDSGGKYVFVSVYVHPSWMDVVWVSDVWGETDLSPDLEIFGRRWGRRVTLGMWKSAGNAEHVTSLFHTAILENVSRDLFRNGLILVHSHCQWFSGICACVHTQPLRKVIFYVCVRNAACTISLNWRTISASAQIVRSSLITASFPFTHFFVTWTLICFQNNR